MAPKRRTKESVLGPKGGGNWGSATRNLGRKKAGRHVNGVQQPARYPPGRRAMAEIIKYRRDGGYLLPKAPFYRLVQEIVAGMSLPQTFRWQKAAAEGLQVAAEQFLVMTMTGKLTFNRNKIICFINLF